MWLPSACEPLISGTIQDDSCCSAALMPVSIASCATSSSTVADAEVVSVSELLCARCSGGGKLICTT